MSGYTVAHDPGSWVTTSDGPLFLEQGETLPEEGVHPDEIARLANAGVLAEYDQELSLVGLGAGDIPPELPDGTVEDLKVRIGTDADLAQAYLDRERAQEKPRGTFVKHLEQVVADAEHQTDPGTPPAGTVPSGEGES